MDVDGVLVGELLPALVAVVVERGLGLLLREALLPEVDLPVGVELVLVDGGKVALLTLVGKVASVLAVVGLELGTAAEGPAAGVADVVPVGGQGSPALGLGLLDGLHKIQK